MPVQKPIAEAHDQPVGNSAGTYLQNVIQRVGFVTWPELISDEEIRQSRGARRAVITGDQDSRVWRVPGIPKELDGPADIAKRRRHCFAGNSVRLRNYVSEPKL